MKIDVNGCKVYKVWIEGVITIKELKNKIKAVKMLTDSEPKMFIFGHYDDSTGDTVFMDSVERRVVSVGDKYLIVDLGREGKVKIDPLTAKDHDYVTPRISMECEIPDHLFK